MSVQQFLSAELLGCGVVVNTTTEAAHARSLAKRLGIKVRSIRIRELTE